MRKKCVDDEAKMRFDQQCTGEKKKDAKKRTKNGHWKVLVGLFLTTNETSTSYGQHNQFSFIRCDYTQVTRNWVNDGANTWCNSENCDKRVSKQQQQQKTTKPTTTKLNWSKMKKKKTSVEREPLVCTRYALYVDGKCSCDSKAVCGDECTWKSENESEN